MTSQRWRQINELLDAVLEHKPEERADILTRACAGDQMLRREVESLLIALEQAGSFMEASPAESAAGLFDDREFAVGQTIGPYRVLSEIGRGGMGVVYLAARADESYSKLVAIKLVRHGLNYDEALRRFRQERQILANLDHPNIARLLDGGTTEHGLPYVVMEYIAGVPVTEYCDARRLSITERLKLFRPVCSAVQFAHQHLVIHRDLKPANILVTEDGTIKLLDFGIAKLLDPDSRGTNTGITQAGSHLMTPDYASPEQVRGAPVTTASDVYSLGVLLYELLTGHRPYTPKTLSLADLETAICETEPEKPSMIVGRVVVAVGEDGAANTSRTPESVSLTREGRPERLRARLRGDLDNIVLMALRKDSRQRYPSAGQLSEDIRRHLEGKGVIARKPTFTYRAGKFMRRHKLGVTAAVVFILTLIGGIIATTRQSHIVATQARNNRRLLYAAQMNLAGQAWDSVNLERVRELVESNVPGPGEEDLRGFEWYYLWRLYHKRDDYMTMRHAGVVWSAAFSPDGRRLASASEDLTAKVWDAATGRELFSLAGHTKWVNAVAFSPDGRRLATVSGDTTAKLWDANKGELLALLEGHTARVNAAVFSPGGERLFTGSDDQTVKVWDTATGREVATLNGHGDVVRGLALSPDGKRLATVGSSVTKVWDLETWKPLLTLRGHTDWVVTVKFSPDGKVLATASYDHVAKLWDANTGRELNALRGHNGRITSITFSPDGREVATASDDRTIRLWDAANGQELASLKGHLRAVESVAFSPDGQSLASASMDQTVKLWRTDTKEKSDSIISIKDNLTGGVTYTRDGRVLAASYLGGATLWNAADGRELLNIEDKELLLSIAFSPDGRNLVSGSLSGTVKVYDTNTGKVLATLKGHTGTTVAAYSPDGRILATAGYDSIVKFWDAATNQELTSFKAHEGRVFGLAFSPDGRMLATGGEDYMVRLWDVASCREVAALGGHGDWVRAVKFSPDGRTLASGSDDLTVKLWDVASHKEITTLKGPAGQVLCIAFSHDGKRLAAGSSDATVRLWDVATGQELIALKGHTDFVGSVEFSPDDKTLVSCSRDHSIRLWRAATEEEVAAQSER